MRRVSSAVAAAASLGLVALAALPGVASASAGVAGARASAQPVSHADVGLPHSPELLRQLRHATARRAPAVLRGAYAAGTAGSAGIGGVDVASFQHPVSTAYPKGAPIGWSQVAGSGVKFAAVKVTEGTYYVNDLQGRTKQPWAATDLQAAQAAGLSTVAYAFGIPNGNGGSADPAAQADFLTTTLAGMSLAQVPAIMLDIEYNPYGARCYKLGKSAMLAWIEGFANEIIAKTGRPPIIYSTQNWLQTCVKDSPALDQYPLWIASYTGTDSPGLLPDDWTDWGLWQYTSSGAVPGISGRTDLDWFNPDGVFQQGKLMAFNPGDLQNLAGAAVSSQVNAYPLESSPALSFSAPNGLPTGLALNTSTGQITGTAPSTLGSAPVTVSVSDTVSGASGPLSFTWYTHGTLSLHSPGPQTTVAGAAVDLNLAGGLTDTPAKPPVSFAAAGLPPGLTLTSRGLVTGWPDAAGTYRVWVRAADTLHAPAAESFTWTVTDAPSARAGFFRLGLGGKCLNDTGGRSRNGTPADLWTCNGSAAERWRYDQDFTVRIHAKCLTAPASAGGRVTLQPCAEVGSQVWRPLSPRSVNKAAGRAAIAFVNPPSGLCLADPGASRKNGTRIVAATCDGHRDQAWTLPAGPLGSQFPGMCLDVRGGRTANGTPIDLRPCRDAPRQRWTARSDGTVRAEGKCLTIRVRATAVGSPLELHRCRGASTQQWRLTDDGDGADLVNPHTRLCLSVPGDIARSGVRLRIAACAALPGQRWHVQ